MTVSKTKNFFLVLFFLSFLFLPKISLASCCRIECGGVADGRQFRADTTECQPFIFSRNCRSVYRQVCDAAGNCFTECNCECDASQTYQMCGSWQKAERPCQVTLWGLQKPECKASGDCIKAPKGPRYYDNPLYPLNPFEPETSKDKNNIYLPVKLDWDDVEGWIEGWQEPPKCTKKRPTGDERCVHDYPGECRDIVGCKKNCKEDCLLKAENFDWNIGDIEDALEKARAEVEKEEKHRDSLPKCIRECEKICENRFLSSKAPPDQCYSEQEFIKSYIIEIRSKKKEEEKDENIFAFKNSELVKEIDTLERALKKGLSLEEKKETKTKILDLRKKLYTQGTAKTGDYRVYGAVSDKSEFISPPCLLQPNRTYQWRVTACGKKYSTYEEAKKANFAGCGPWNDPRWEFKTNRAPEPKLPYDPDWSGQHRSKNLPKWEIGYLRWCEIDDPQIYGKMRLEDVVYFPPMSFPIIANYSEQHTLGRDQGTENYQCHPNFEKAGGGCTTKLRTANPEENQFFPPAFFWDQNSTFFTKITPYEWKLKSCANMVGEKCCDPGKECFSQTWRFSGENFKLEKPILAYPFNDDTTPIGLPVMFSWRAPYALSFKVEVSGFPTAKVKGGNLLLNNLKLDTVYSWRVLPCWDYDAEKCEDIAWSDVYKFRTTGRPPKKETMEPNGESPFPPITFKWENVPGVQSYIFKLDPGGIEEVVKENTTTLDYPDILLDTDYFWKVRTCAGEGGQNCGKESEVVRFKTPQLSSPEITRPFPDPNLGVAIFTAGESSYKFSWKPSPGAKYYLYRLQCEAVSPLEQEKENCQTGEIITKTTNSTEAIMPLYCLGTYVFSVKACLGGDCEFPKTGSRWAEREFYFVPSTSPSGWKSLIPCGQSFNDPDTPWDETKPCQFRHFFLLLRNIISFIVERIVPLSLVILIVFTGVILYLSRGLPGTVVDLKKAWRLAGIGYGIVFLAWSIVNFVLALMRYQIGIFGHWWEIKF